MEKGKGLRGKWQWLVNIMKNGLLLFGIRNRLAKIGFDLEPYFVEIEGISQAKEPVIRDDKHAYELVRMMPEDVRRVSENVIGLVTQEFLVSLARNPICIGLRHEGGDIAAYMLIDTGRYTYKSRTISMDTNEAYLQGMYTFEAFRGKNLAPYLRYKSYELLMEEGKDRLYSITSYFNRSSHRFKKKLGVKHLSLRMSIVLFRKYYWDFPLTYYPGAS